MMISRLYFVVFLISFILPVGDAQAADPLASVTYDYLAKHGDNSYPTLRTFSFDLNEDGRVDAIVLLTGNNWCGSGGCNMLVFQGTDSGFKFISKSTITQEPIAVLPETEHGWHTLVVMSGGIGKVLMQFDGQQYPSNPSLQIKASKTQIEQAQDLPKNLLAR